MYTSILLANASAFDVGVEKLRSGLLPIAFVLVVLGIWESAWKVGSNPKAILGLLLKAMIIVLLVSGFPDLMASGKAAFDDLKSIVSPNLQTRFNELLNGGLPKADAWSVGEYIASLIVWFLQFLGWIGMQIIISFQDYAIGCLKAVSPLMIGLLAVSYTQNIGIRFLTTSLCVVMWGLGFIFVDLFLNYLGTGVFAGSLATGVGALRAGMLTIIGWPAAIGTMLVAALVPTFLYAATPMAIAKLMEGANAGAAAAWGGLSNMGQTAQHISRGAAAVQQMQQAAATKKAVTEAKVERPQNPNV